MSTQAQSTKGMVWFGLLFMAVGSFIIFSALDIIPTDESSFYAPRWVVAAAGWLFFAAGLALAATFFTPRTELKERSTENEPIPISAD